METLTLPGESIQHWLSAAFPAMAADEFELLKQDIATHGVQTPVVMFEGLVLDGMHRWRAATELGLYVPATVLSEGSDPVAYVLTRNLYRRHLTASQRAYAVVKVNEFAPAGRPAAKPCTRCKNFMTNAEMAEAAQTSVRTISHAKDVHQHGSEDLKQAAQAGTVSVKQAAQLLKSSRLTAVSPASAIDTPGNDAGKKMSKFDVEHRLRIEAQRRGDILFNLFLSLQTRVLRRAGRAPKADERQLMLPHFKGAPR